MCSAECRCNDSISNNINIIIKREYDEKSNGYFQNSECDHYDNIYTTYSYNWYVNTVITQNKAHHVCLILLFKKGFECFINNYSIYI